MRNVEVLLEEVPPVSEDFSLTEVPSMTLLPEEAHATSLAAAPGFRAIWVQIAAAKTPEQADTMLDRVVEGNFDTIFYCVGSGAAPYRSELVTPLSFVTAEYDPLAYVVEQAHARGLLVHAWWNPGLIMDYGSLRDERPEWDIASLPEIPDDIHWPNFSLPEVRQFVGDVVMEIVDNYAVEGVHLDYIRYPDACSSEGAGCRDFFEVEDISLTVHDTYRRLKERWPDVQLSAAVIAVEEVAATYYLQSWPDWLAGGYIDYIMPMAYLSPSRNEQLVQYLATWESLEGASRIVPGLSVFVDSDSLELKTPEQLGKQLALCKKYGFESVALFDERLISDRLLDALSVLFAAP
jgi:uncharacterized lipoprotein YddW (UPF0748 family)